MSINRYLLFFFIIATLFACKKDEPQEIYDLTFPSDTYYVSEGSELFLYINQGNQKYEVETSDKSIIETRIDESLWPAGGIYVKGLKKGDTKLTVKDQITGQEVALTVHVVDPYLLFRLSSLVPAIKVPDQMPEATRNKIRDEVSAYGTLQLDQIIILHRNADRRFFIFENHADLHAGKIQDSGSYELSFIDGGEHQLTLQYADGKRSSKFSILTYSPQSKEVLTSFSGTSETSSKFPSTSLSASSRNAAPSLIDKNAFNASPDLLAESPIENFEGIFLLYTDLTSDFKTKYPDVESVWLTQQARLWLDFQNYKKIGDGVFRE